MDDEGAVSMEHDWEPSRLGHGEMMCKRCFATNREAAALGLIECDAPPKPPATANDNQARIEVDEDGDQPFICPVTCQPCCTEQDEFCEDYGCARQAGIDVDRDIV